MSTTVLESNARQSDFYAAHPRDDAHPETSSRSGGLEEQCPECETVGDFPTVGGDSRYEVELECTNCRASVYVRITDY